MASHETVEQMVKVLLKYVDKETAIKLARDLHNHVRGNKSVVDKTMSGISLVALDHDPRQRATDLGV